MKKVKPEVMEALKATIQKLYDERGEIRASELIAACKPKTAPAHDAFEWDDKVCGVEYRLHQARQYVKKISVIYEEQPAKMVHVPLVVRAEDSREGAYKPIPAVVANVGDFDLALRAAIRRLSSAQEAVNDLQRAANALPERDERHVVIAQVSTALAALNTALDRVVH